MKSWIIDASAAAMIAGATLAVVCATPASAQERPVVWTASASPAAVAPGATTTIQLKARIDQGWHVYSISQGPGGPIPTGSRSRRASHSS